MPRRFLRKTFAVPIAAAGLAHDYIVPNSFFRSGLISMTLITPDYTTASPTTTISFRDVNGVIYFTDTARNENGTYQVTLGWLVMHPGDIIRATLASDAGAITTVTVILHIEE